jgi:hypothetical protein
MAGSLPPPPPPQSQAAKEVVVVVAVVVIVLRHPDISIALQLSQFSVAEYECIEAPSACLGPKSTSARIRCLAQVGTDLRKLGQVDIRGEGRVPGGRVPGHARR